MGVKPRSVRIVRGRKRGQITPRRAQVLAVVHANRDVSIAHIARLCGISDHRNARRIIRDLRGMGLC